MDIEEALLVRENMYYFMDTTIRFTRNIRTMAIIGYTEMIILIYAIIGFHFDTRKLSGLIMFMGIVSAIVYGQISRRCPVFKGFLKVARNARITIYLGMSGCMFTIGMWMITIDNVIKLATNGKSLVIICLIPAVIYIMYVSLKYKVVDGIDVAYNAVNELGRNW